MSNAAERGPPFPCPNIRSFSRRLDGREGTDRVRYECTTSGSIVGASTTELGLFWFSPVPKSFVSIPNFSWSVIAVVADAMRFEKSSNDEGNPFPT